MTRKKHIVGNWKMNQLSADIKAFFEEFNKADGITCNCGIASQGLHIGLLSELAPKGDYFAFGTQNCANNNSGAFTGELSPEAIKDIGCGFTLTGHSERRAIYGETDELINEKTKLALDNGLNVIFCFGETLEERESGKTEDVVRVQLDKGLAGISDDLKSKIILAYEPVWAIGTGKTASPAQAQEVHAFIRKHVSANLGFNAEEVIIQYGGSVKPGNVEELLACPDIDGALVGGASIKASDFIALCTAGSK